MGVKTPEQLINNIIGQLEGIKKMMDNDAECARVIVQMKAARSAFNSLFTKYLADQTDKCLHEFKGAAGRDKLNRLIAEVVKSKM